MNATFALFFPLIMFGILHMIFLTQVSQASVDNEVNIITNSTWPQSSTFENDQFVLWNFNVTNIFFGGSEIATWQAGLPIGWFTFAFANIDFLLDKAIALSTLVLLIASFPFEAQSILVISAFGIIYAVLFIMFGYGLWKGASPFSGGG